MEVWEKIENELLALRDETQSRHFHDPDMPRTMLRYAIEKLDVPTRHHYMTKPKLPTPDL